MKNEKTLQIPIHTNTCINFRSFPYPPRVLKTSNKALLMQDYYKVRNLWKTFFYVSILLAIVCKVGRGGEGGHKSKTSKFQVFCGKMKT